MGASEPVPTTKGEWRRWARRLEPVTTDVAARVAGHVERFLGDVDGPVLGYLALPDEIPVAIGTVLPRVGDDGTMTLHHDVGSNERHRVGLDQPPPDAPTVAPGELAAVLVPGRVFDHDGFRLGRGGGHYDRLLPQLASGIPVVGVTCTARIVDRLPREPHDRPMNHLVTEHGVRPIDP
ncbi:MAG: 5-formyltetrahydrofolate cyclo-ligase [Acidimicrobiales bacterium]|nr:5-formyltetrahydrofolate cyclo-ligase [Acidimicrobiales bacterium]